MPFKEPVHHIVRTILESYGNVGGINHLDGTNLPSRESVVSIISDLEALIFPGFEREAIHDAETLPYATAELVFRIARDLIRETDKALQFRARQEDLGTAREAIFDQASEAVFGLLKKIPEIRSLIQDDVMAALEGDPAAKSMEEVILSYPGVEAILVHRLAHELWTAGVPLIPRMMSEHIHRKTGIDIHPGATIGRRFFIDHGTGVVIGETTTIGNNVKVYQGVTLGALSVKKSLASKKRHPTIEDGVTLYAGATILGGDTVIGHHSTIGGNVALTESIPAYTIVSGKPQEHLMMKKDIKAHDYSI